MVKVLTERPRHGSSNSSRKTGFRLGKFNPDREYDFPKRISSSRKRQYGHSSKDFNDLISPLRRFLGKMIGRQWDKVYSQICKNIPGRTLAAVHVLRHVDWEVEKNCYIGKDGIIYKNEYYNGQASRVCGFYVHPLTGLLCFQTFKKFENEIRKKQQERIFIDYNYCYQKINGIWFLIEFVETSGLVSDFTEKGKNFIIVNKKQLNRKELMTLCLKNSARI